MGLEPLAHRQRDSAFLGFDERLHARRRRRRRRARGTSRECRRRAAPAWCGSRRTWPSGTRPCPAGRGDSSPSSTHALELAAAHALHAVMKREALVHERVIRREQVHDAAVGFEDAADEQLELLRERRHEIGGVVREEVRIRARRASAPLTFSHWNAKFGDERRARAGRAACGAPAPPALAARAACRSRRARISSSSGERAHRKNERREARSMSDDAERLPGLRAGRRCVARYRNFGLTRMAMMPFWMPVSKPDCARPSL